MSDEQRNTVWRFAMIFIVILLGFVAVLGKIIYIQAVEREAWLKVA
jgi:cell division protein FtsI/penicillin-binding protein 2